MASHGCHCHGLAAMAIVCDKASRWTARHDCVNEELLLYIRYLVYCLMQILKNVSFRYRHGCLGYLVGAEHMSEPQVDLRVLSVYGVHSMDVWCPYKVRPGERQSQKFISLIFLFIVVVLFFFSTIYFIVIAWWHFILTVLFWFTPNHLHLCPA